LRDCFLSDAVESMVDAGEGRGRKRIKLLYSIEEDTRRQGENHKIELNEEDLSCLGGPVPFDRILYDDG